MDKKTILDHYTIDNKMGFLNNNNSKNDLCNKIINLSRKKENLKNEYILLMVANNLPDKANDLFALNQVINHNVNTFCYKIIIYMCAGKTIKQSIKKITDDFHNLTKTINDVADSFLYNKDELKDLYKTM